MAYTCSKCFTTDFTRDDGEWLQMNKLGRNFEWQLELLGLSKETYFKKENGKKYYWRCRECIETTKQDWDDKSGRIRKNRIKEKAKITKSIDNEDKRKQRKLEEEQNRQKKQLKRLSKTQKQQNNKLDDVSSRVSKTEQDVTVCQADIQELKNSDIEQNKEIRATQTKTDQNSEDIKQTNESVKKNTEENKQLEARNTALEENQTKLWGKVFPAKKIPQTIYDFTNWKYYVGWPIFLIFTGCVIKKVYRTKTRKRKESKNYLVEIHRIFQEWQLNMYASTGGYVVGFYLIKEAIEKWINPRISNWLVTQKLITLSVVCLIIGIGFYVDGIITSSLKTPLQRLAIRIENANIDEKTKRSLLSKTQQVNELFKETLKRFGLLAVVGILTKLIEIYWNKDILSYLSYAVPIAGAVKIIWEVDKTLKRLKLNGSKK